MTKKSAKPWAQELVAREAYAADEQAQGLDLKLARLLCSDDSLRKWGRTEGAPDVAQRSRSFSMAQLWEGVTPDEVKESLHRLFKEAGVEHVDVEQVPTARQTTRVIRVTMPEDEFKKHRVGFRAMYEAMNANVGRALGGK